MCLSVVFMSLLIGFRVAFPTAAVASNGRMTVDELEKVWKEAVMACFKVLFQHLLGGLKKS
jgi:hypothetical protein